MSPALRKYAAAAIFFLGIVLFARYFLPLFLPFLLGAGLAVAAEPLVGFLCSRLRLKRPLAAGIGITMAFSFLALTVMVLCAFLIRELRNLAGMLPELEASLQGGMETADRWLHELTGRVPGELGALLSRNVDALRSDSSALLSRAANGALKLASGLLSHVPGSALAAATGIIASFMISAKLPKIRSFLRQHLPHDRIAGFSSTIGRLKTALTGWLRAQLRLSGVTFLLAAGGLLLLRVPRAVLWAVLIALVDAFPILGTGTVLVPWSLIAFLQGDTFLAFGLLGLYGAGAVTRSVLEPRLLGRQLGLDPLVTLMALYAGFRLWGIVGMILAPMLAVVVTQLLTPETAE